MNREKEPALCACIAVLSAKARRCLASAIEHMLFSPRGGPSLDTLENAYDFDLFEFLNFEFEFELNKSWPRLIAPNYT